VDAAPGLGLDHPALLVVSDGSGDPARVLALGRAATAGGAWGFQIREPALGGKALVDLARALGGGVLRILVNDRADVAIAAPAFGVQLGEQALPPARVRAAFGERLRIGRSVHDVAGVRAASAGGADWLLFGHVLPTPSKPGAAPAGFTGLAAACAASTVPVFAIGGMDAGRVGPALAAGARGVAVIGAVAAAPEPARAVRALVQALAEG
jgi:thiamine-phosphate diphosphorylase